ncbi:MAG: sodium-dependent transporter, partial [Holophagales bacterium]|nr:sodium-dependent transporter [Holophagales bacterium]
VFLLFLVGRALTLEGAGAGLEFMFSADFSKLEGPGIISALGQALFSLSIGMGAMITYGSYLSEKENIPISAISVAVFDTSIALLGGLIIFPTLFATGADPAQGPGLVFVVMASIFNTLPMGHLFAILFYGLLAIAALTSTISLLEVIASYFIDDRKWSRSKAVWVSTLACFAIAIPSALSLGAVPALTSLGNGNGFLGMMSIIWGDLSLPVGATLLCLFVAWRWGIPSALRSIEAGGELPMSGAWAFLVRFVSPVAVLAVLGYTIYSLF